MAKVVPRQKKRSPRRGTNWVMIGGIVVVGVIALFALLFASLQGQGTPTPTLAPVTALTDFCAANEVNCIEKGNPEAAVTVVEVSDYACIHCRNFNLDGTAEAIDEMYVESGRVQWIVLPYSTNSSTRPAAEASFCAAEQDMFFEYHESMFGLFGTDSAYSRDGILSAAGGAGLDLDSFEACLDAGNYTDTLQRNLSTAVGAGVRATPTFFINGRMVEGNLPLPNFQDELDRELGS